MFLPPFENFDRSDRYHSTLDERIKLCEQRFYMSSGIDHFYNNRQIIRNIDEALCGEVMLWAKTFNASLHGGSQYAMLNGQIIPFSSWLCSTTVARIRPIPMP